MKKGYFGVFLLVFALIACGCVGAGCGRETQATARATIAEVFPMTVGDAKISVHVAVSQIEQEKGLMFRTELADNVGMIFAYKEPQKMHYWMKNVPIPLSIGFFKADGTLAEIRAMFPNDTSTISSSGDDIKFVLEMNEGWFARHNVRPGDRLDLALLAKALELRGEEPADYGL